MTKRKEIKTTITVPEDLYWKFQEALPLRRVSMKDAVRQALEQWVTIPSIGYGQEGTSGDIPIQPGQGEVPGVPLPKIMTGRTKQAYAALAAIFDSQDAQVVAAIEANLEAFRRLITTALELRAQKEIVAQYVEDAESAVRELLARRLAQGRNRKPGEGEGGIE